MNYSFKNISILAVFGVLTIAKLSFAGPINVLTLDETRAGTQMNSSGTTIDWNFMSEETDAAFLNVYNAMRDTNNFGPSGIVDREIHFLPQANQINSSALSNTDIVVISDSSYTLTLDERNLLAEFVYQGGGLFLFDNHAGTKMGSYVGITTTSTANLTSEENTINSTSPVINGLFGNVASQVSTLRFGYGEAFTSLGSSTPVVSYTQDPYYMGASVAYGSGKMVLFGDESIFNRRSVSELCAGNYNSYFHTIFLNSIDYITPDESFQYMSSTMIPEPASIVLLCVSVVIGVLKSRKK